MKTLIEPAREVRVRADVDVIVCGGGSAGAIAALAAARQGARTVLVEQHGFMGGVNTAAMVNGVGGWQYELDGTPLVRSIPLEVIRRVVAEGRGSTDYVDKLAAPLDGPPNYRAGGLGCYWIRTNPEATKFVLDRMMQEAGVTVYLRATAVMPIVDGSTIRGIYMESKSGREAILAKTVVDCTGDGDIAARAGAEFEVGRPGDGLCQPMTMMYTLGNAPPPRLHFGAPEKDPETNPLYRGRFVGAVADARRRGIIKRNPNDLLCAHTQIHGDDRTVGAVNFTRIQRRSAIDVVELTAAEMEGREQVWEALEFHRTYVPGNENAYIAFTAPHIGIRESRRIVGDYYLTGEDVRASRTFDDGIARGIYLLDIHNPADGKPSMLQMLDAPYSIPYRCLLPRGLDGLLVAGRCISGDHIALASYRVQSHAMAIGQAAGTAAALAVASRCTPRGLEAREVIQTLRAAGANTGPQTAAVG
jgi:hypothetical protein